MKQRLLLFFISMLLPLAMMGQISSVTVEFPSIHPTGSLIANATSIDATLIYDQHNQDQSYLYLFREEDRSAKRVEIPSHLIIEAMDCLGHYLYVGGHDSASGRGFIGLVNVVEWDNYGTVVLEWTDIPTITEAGSDHVATRVSALTPFFAQGKAHVAFITDLSINMSPVGNTVGEAMFSGSFWDIRLNNQGLEHHYNDIDVTDHYVVAVGYHPSDPQHYCLTAWEKTEAFILSPLPQARFVIAEAVGNADNSLLTRLEGDRVVVAYIYENLHGGFVRDDLFQVVPTGVFPIVGYEKNEGREGCATKLTDLNYAGGDTVTHVFGCYLNWYLGIHPLGGSWESKVLANEYAAFRRICKGSGNDYKTLFLFHGIQLYSGYERLPSTMPNCFSPIGVGMGRVEIDGKRSAIEKGHIKVSERTSRLFLTQESIDIQQICSSPQPEN